MSIFSSAIKKVRKIGQKVGTLARKAAPIVGLIPGVGTVAGGLIGGIGSIAEGHRGLKGTLGSALAGATSGFANSKLLGGKGILGVKGALESAAARMRGTPGVPGAPGAPAGAAPGGQSTMDSLKDAALGLIPHNKSGGVDLAKILALAGAGYAAYSGNKSANDLRDRQTALTDKQLGLADEVAGQGRLLSADANTLRAQSMPILQARLAAGPRATPNFSQFNDQLNPFAKRFPPAISAPPPAQAAPPAAVAPPLGAALGKLATLRGGFGAGRVLPR